MNTMNMPYSSPQAKRQNRIRVLFSRRALVGFLSAVLCAGILTASPSEDAAPSSPILHSLSPEERQWLTDHPEITVAQDPNWPPVEFIDASGEPSGMSMDYLQLIESRLGVKFTPVKNLSWQEAYSRLKSRQIDMTMSVTVTEERKKFWAFTKPYMHMPIVIASNPDVTFISGLHELAGKRVAVVDGYAINDWIPADYPDIQLLRVKTALEGLKQLEEGKVFAYIDNQLVIGYLLAKHEELDIKIAGETRYANFQCIAVRKDWPILATILDKALNSIGEEERQTIYRKWLPMQYDRGFDYSLLWQVLIGVSLVFGLLLWWNRKLSLEIRNRKQAEHTLRESESKFRDLFHKHGAVKLLIDPQSGDIIDANEAAVRFYGWPAEKMKQMNIEEINTLPQEQIQKVLDAARQNNRVHFDFHHKTADGSVRDVEVFSSGIQIKGKTVLYSIIHDISEKRLLEEHLRQAERMDSVGRLAGGIAHDFNNMLNVIQGYTEMALQHNPENNKLQEYLQEILKATRRSTSITRQLLAFARRQTHHPVEINLNDTISGALEMLKRLIGEDIELTWLPGPETHTVMMDPVQIDQILANLCINARDAIQGVGKITIKTDNMIIDESFCSQNPGMTEGSYAVLSVRDSGCGMSEETRSHLFEPFFTTKDLGKGTGLGLATIYGIVKQNAGHILVSSEPGCGTTFTLFFPISQGAAEPMIRTSQMKTRPGQGETILLVEDETALLELCQQMLVNLGYSVIASSKPSDALRMARDASQPITLLITDLVMPEMNGRVLADELLKHYPELKILFMSGYTANIISNRGGLSQTGEHFLPKPFSQEDLAQKISQALHTDA